MRITPLPVAGTFSSVGILTQPVVASAAAIAARPALQQQAHPARVSAPDAAHIKDSAFARERRTDADSGNSARARPKTAARGGLIANALFAAFAALASPAGCTKGCSELLEETDSAGVIYEQYRVLEGVKDNLESRRDEFVALTQGEGLDILRRADRISALLREAVEQVEVANAAISRIQRTGVKFNSSLFEDLNKQLNQYIWKLNPDAGTVSELHGTADRIRKSRGRLGWYNRLIKKYGVSPDGVIRLSNSVKAARKSLIDLRSGIRAISSEDVDGYSTNLIVNDYLKDKMGPCFPRPRVFDDFDHLKTGSRGKDVVELQKLLQRCALLDDEPDGAYGAKTRTAHIRAKTSGKDYCALMRELAAAKPTDNITMTEDRAVAIQKMLIIAGELPPGSADGKFGKKSKAAWNRAVNKGYVKNSEHVCEIMERMRDHMRANGKDVRNSRGRYAEIVYEFGFEFCYLPYKVETMDIDKRKCLVDSMIRSESFKELMSP